MIKDKQHKHSYGFTVVELVTVIVIIGILAGISYVTYSGIQAKASDTSVLSDIDAMDGLQTSYGLKNKVAGKAYYSGSGYDADLDFKASEGNVIDVVINSSDYCIRGYNPNSTKKTIGDAYIKESSPGVCTQLQASAEATGGPKTWKQLAVGYDHSCAIASDNKAYCWGAVAYDQYSVANEVGQLGIGTTGISNGRPLAVKSDGALAGLTIKSISTNSSASTTCVIASNNKAYCWGAGSGGELGQGQYENSSEPVAVKTTGALNGLTLKSISVGYGHTCAIASNNYAYCWGSNGSGELGSGDALSSNEPVAVKITGALNGLTIKSIEAGSPNTQFVCAIASNNQAYCWGSGAEGQLGNGSFLNSNEPVAVRTDGVLAGLTIKSLEINYWNSCAIASDNNAYCWGWDMDGQLGNGLPNQNSNVPVAVETGGVLVGLSIKFIHSADEFTCAIASNNKAYCWGRNGSNQLGNNTGLDSSVPVAVFDGPGGVLNGKTIKALYVANWFTCAIASDDKAYCWGPNWDGELGNNPTGNGYPVAVNTSGLLNGLTIKSITTAGFVWESAACAIASDNQIYCWGSNYGGRFGNGTSFDNIFLPVKTDAVPE